MVGGGDFDECNFSKTDINKGDDASALIMLEKQKINIPHIVAW